MREGTVLGKQRERRKSEDVLGAHLNVVHLEKALPSHLAVYEDGCTVCEALSGQPILHLEVVPRQHWVIQKSVRVGLGSLPGFSHD
jgi:hypothetical protein